MDPRDHYAGLNAALFDARECAGLRRINSESCANQKIGLSDNKEFQSC